MNKVMTEQEMLDYLLLTGSYKKGTEKHPYMDLFYEQRMMNTDDTILIKDLVEDLLKWINIVMGNLGTFNRFLQTLI